MTKMELINAGKEKYAEAEKLSDDICDAIYEVCKDGKKKPTEVQKGKIITHAAINYWNKSVNTLKKVTKEDLRQYLDWICEIVDKQKEDLKVITEGLDEYSGQYEVWVGDQEYEKGDW